jgi:hypothetical protein
MHKDSGGDAATPGFLPAQSDLSRACAAYCRKTGFPPILKRNAGTALRRGQHCGPDSLKGESMGKRSDEQLLAVLSAAAWRHGRASYLRADHGWLHSHA